MREVCSLIWLALVGAFRSRAALEAENTILRHQLNVLRRQSPKSGLVVRAMERAQNLFLWFIRGADFDNDSAFMNDVVVPRCRAQKDRGDAFARRQEE